MRNEEVMKPLILKQGSLNFAEKPVMPCSLGKAKLLLNITAVQNKLEGAFKIGIRPQKHKRSDRIYF